MKATEAAALLTIAAAYDNRKPDADQAKAWAMVLDGLRFEDCRSAIVAHYRTSREWMMPSDVVAGVKRLRSERVSAFGIIPDPTHLDPDSETFDRDYQRYISATYRAIADGELVAGDVPPTIEGPPRDVESLGQIGRSVPRA